MSNPDRPRKAYYVEKVSRTVTLLLVYADDPVDAKRRATMEGDAVASESEGRGFGSVRRVPSEDRDA